MKKFELTSEFITNVFGVKLFRIRALIEFGDVKAGDLGGYIEKEENLDHDGNAWVTGNARVYGDADYATRFWALQPEHYVFPLQGWEGARCVRMLLWRHGGVPRYYQ